jgi:hypothetical protein
MNVLRKIVKVKNHRLTVAIPDDFSNEEYEVIVLPVENDKSADIDLSKKKTLTRKEMLGKWKGKIWMSPDFDEPLEDFTSLPRSPW